jgi:AraC-like DNA-binding protein
MIEILIVTSIICLILSMLSGVYMLIDKSNFFNKWMPLVFLLFFILKFADLLNLIINHPSFYNLFNFTYTDFQISIKAICTLLFPIFLISFFRSISSSSGNKVYIYSICSLFIVIIILNFFFLDQTLSKFLFTSYLSFSFLYCLVLIFKNKEVLQNYSIYYLLFVLILSLLLLLIGTAYMNFTAGNLFSNDQIVLVHPLNYNYFNSDGYSKLLLNLFVISVSGAFLLNRKLVYGSYYFESKENLVTRKNHWSFVRIGKLDDKDHKVHQEIKDEALNIINKVIDLETKYIRNEIMFDSIESVSQFLIIKTNHIEFIFKYYNTLSFSKFLLKIKMIKASYLIESGYLKENTVENLANELGYNSRSAFFTKFKAINGYSPSKY